MQVHVRLKFEKHAAEYQEHAACGGYTTLYPLLQKTISRVGCSLSLRVFVYLRLLASPYDKIWGIGITKEDAEAGKEWKGLNLLGKVRRTVE